MLHPLPGPNAKHKLTLSEAKQNLRAADGACVKKKKKKKYDNICAQNGLKFLPIIFESTGKMHPLLQDFLAIIMDTMTMHINPQYKYITMFYWSTRLSCCLQKSIAKSLTCKYSASYALPIRDYISVILTVSFPLSEISLSYLLVWLYVFEAMIVILVRRTRSLSILYLVAIV